jgi:RNA polymerase sigma-70 factor (ECF subfamily)
MVIDNGSGTRWTLIRRLKDWNDQEGWKNFFDLYWKLIYSVAMQSGLTDAEAQEVVQETVITVAHKMKAFAADSSFGSFKAWLLQLTRRRIIDQLRKRPPPGRFAQNPAPAEDTTRTSTLERLPAPQWEHHWDVEWKKNLIDAAIERVKLKASPKQYKIFYLHVLREQPATQVAKTLNVHVAQVYLAKSRFSAMVRKEAALLEKGPF